MAAQARDAIHNIVVSNIEWHHGGSCSLGEGNHEVAEPTDLPQFDFPIDGSFDYGLDGKWFEFNDSNIHPRRITDLAGEYGGGGAHCAYMLVYRRRDPESAVKAVPPVPESLVPDLIQHNEELEQQRVEWEIESSRIVVKIVTLDQFELRGNALVTKGRNASHTYSNSGASTAAAADSFLEDDDAGALGALAELEEMVSGGQGLYDELEPFQGTVNDGIVNLRVDRDTELNIFIEMVQDALRVAPALATADKGSFRLDKFVLVGTEGTTKNESRERRMHWK